MTPGTALAHGIYAVRVHFDGEHHDGAAYLGTRPTFDDGAPVLEVFLLDFDGDLYGREIEVEFIDFIRGDRRFDGMRGPEGADGAGTAARARRSWPPPRPTRRFRGVTRDAAATPPRRVLRPRISRRPLARRHPSGADNERQAAAGSAPDSLYGRSLMHARHSLLSGPGCPLPQHPA